MNTAKITPIRSLVFLGAAAALLASSLLFASSGARADTASTTPPILSNVIVTPSDTGATITWNSDQAATGQVVYGLTSAYDASSTLDSTLTNSHTAFLGGLSPGTTYHYQIQSNNASGTAQTLATTVDATFVTTGAASSTASTSAPMITAIVATPTDTGASITWTTDQNSSSQVLYGLDATYGNTSTLDNTQVTSHNVSLSGLTPNTLYHFQVWSANGSSTSASSTDMTFTTSVSSTTASTTPDAAPVISNIVSTSTDTTATITWATDKGATTQVLYGLTNAYGSMSTFDNTAVLNHSVLLMGLTAN